MATTRRLVLALLSAGLSFTAGAATRDELARVETSLRRVAAPWCGRLAELDAHGQRHCTVSFESLGPVGAGNAFSFLDSARITDELLAALSVDELAAVMAQEAEQVVDVEARISLEKALAKLHESKRKDPIATGEAWARIANLASGDDEAINTAVGYFEKGERPDLAVVVLTENLPAISDDATRAELLGKLGGLRQQTSDALGAGEAFAEAATLTKSASLWESAQSAFVTAEAWDQAATAVDERAQLTSDAAAKAALYATEADYLSRAGDDASSVLRLEQATELDPKNDDYAGALEQRYRSAERIADLTSYLLKRAEKLDDKSVRAGLRRRDHVLVDVGEVTRVETAFGTFDVSTDEIITFPAGLPGFEECRRFVVLSSRDLEPFQCLQSVEGPSASFLAVDPRRAFPDYRCVLSDVDRVRLGEPDESSLVWLAVVTVLDDQTLVNLRAPVVVNPTRMLGYQLMPSNSLYPLRFELARLY